MRLTEHFTLEEMIASETAARKGIDNTPPAEVLPNLRYVCRQLEKIRAKIKQSIHVNSGYRCLELNNAVGSLPSSKHVKGLAADIIAPRFGSALELCKLVASMPEEELPFDQLIFEFGAWCHIGFSVAGTKPRRQLLTIDNLGVHNGLR